jgi:predicted MFS family arabinose efflux permease
VAHRPAAPRRTAQGASVAWFWATATVLFVFVTASAAPAPLYRVYQHQWAFSDATLTAVFAVYVVTLLTAILTAGSLSDHLGRRPVIIAGLILAAITCSAFLSADSVEALFLARCLQGIAVGFTAGALNATLIDLRPTGESAPLIASTTPFVALGFGALATSLLVQYGPIPTRLPWWALLFCFITCLGLAVAMPETGAKRPGALKSLRPKVSVPKDARSAFAIAVPSIGGSWALGGFYFSLGPSLVARQLDSTNLVWGGVTIALLCAAAATASVARRNNPPTRIMFEGCLTLAIGGVLSVVAIATRSPATLLVSTAIAGAGFGMANLGGFRTIVANATADDRAGLVAAIFIVTYVGFGGPALAAGFATTRYGLHDTALVYCGAVAALAGAVSLLAKRALRGRPSVTADVTHVPCVPVTDAYLSRRRDDTVNAPQERTPA